MRSTGCAILPLLLLTERVRYVEVSVNRGEWGPFCHIREVSPEIGQAAVRGCRRIRSLEGSGNA